MKSKSTAFVLCLFLGGIGAHKFYLGQGGQGILYLLFSWTFIPAFIAFFELFIIAFMSQHDFDRKFNGGQIGGPQVHQSQEVRQQVVVHVPSASTQSPAAGQTMAQQIQALSELRASGALTEEEFTTQKHKLLGIDPHPATFEVHAPAQLEVGG